MHEMLAASLKFPELRWSNDTARNVAEAVRNVQAHYPSAQLLSDQHMAIVGLLAALAQAYTPAVVVVISGRPEPRKTAPPIAAPVAPVAGLDHSWFDATPAGGPQ